MRDFNEHTITQAVIERFADTPDPRLKSILTSLISHLHGFVREIEPSFDEWMAAIQFLTRTGQTCTDKRQEFILLSDTLGVSMLVDTINHRMPEGTTETTVMGPFYVTNPPDFPGGADISGGAKGQPLHAEINVASANGQPVADAVVDVWQSDDDGYYDVQHPNGDLTLRARFRTDSDGRLTFWSILPSSYPIPDDGPVGDMLRASKRHPFRPAHVHFMITAPAHETLVTHVFVDGDQYLNSDPVFGVKESLVTTFEQRGPSRAPDGRSMAGPWRSLRYDFALKPKTR